MFEKILIAEDFDSTNNAIKIAVKELNIPIIDQVFYCDDALLKIQRAILDHNPYDLLITDLSFNPDEKKQLLSSGEELIRAAKKEQPSLKIIVLSIENRRRVIKLLQDYFHVDGFITKGRGDIELLKKAITEVYKGNSFISVAEESKHVNDISDENVELVRLLASRKVEEVSAILKNRKLKSSSVSSINKRIKFLKDAVNAKSIGELITIFTYLGYFNNKNNEI